MQVFVNNSNTDRHNAGTVHVEWEDAPGNNVSIVISGFQIKTNDDAAKDLYDCLGYIYGTVRSQ